MESIHLNSDKMETHFDIAHINLGQNVFLYPPTHYFHLGEPLSKVKDIITTGLGMFVPSDIDKEIDLIVRIRSESHYYFVSDILSNMLRVSTLNELGEV